MFPFYSASAKKNHFDASLISYASLFQESLVTLQRTAVLRCIPVLLGDNPSEFFKHFFVSMRNYEYCVLFFMQLSVLQCVLFLDNIACRIWKMLLITNKLKIFTYKAHLSMAQDNQSAVQLSKHKK